MSNFKLQGRVKDYSPVKWCRYYEEQRQVETSNGTFQVYTAGSDGPVLLLLHGGGYSALTWSLLVSEVKKKVNCQIAAVDLRGHGSTKTSDDEDLSLETLVSDVACLVRALYGDEAPGIILVGHSLGGSITVAAAAVIPSVIGVCVIDVVEGTAMESLSSMHLVLKTRPSSFKSVESAIQWSLHKGQTCNLESARVSMPGQIKNLLTNELASNEEDSNEKDLPDAKTRVVGGAADSKSATQRTDVGDDLYTWRTDLSKTERYWSGWFKGMSQKFLELPLPKLLLLANIQRLDTALTVGQMQGKFQLHVLPKSGHVIHEDQPSAVAEIIAGFMVKQKLASWRKS